MSFSKSTRKVATKITPVKISGERRNTTEVQDTVRNTLHSAWTPVKGGVLNAQLFEERKCLIGHWFEHWTDAQRRQFLEHLVEKFNRMSVHFVHNMIKDQIPKEPADFTQTLPRHLVFKVLQYLDPRTLAQASLVCWYWKWLCEHDEVWKPKCLRRGWDYGKPEPPYERAVWKRFYQQQVWDLLHPPPPPLNLDNSLNVEEDGALLNSSFDSTGSAGRRSSSGGLKKKSKAASNKPKSYKLGESQPLNIGYMKHKEQELPPWRSSDNKPKDIQLFNKQILGINSENVPRHIAEKFTKVEITRSPQSPRCTSPLQRAKSIDQVNAKKSSSRDRVTPSSSPLQSKSLVVSKDRSKSDQGILKSSSSGNMLDKSSPRRASNPGAKRNQQSPMVRKLNGLNTKTMAKATSRTPSRGTLKKANSEAAEKEAVSIPTAWGDRNTAKKVASTDTLGSDAALDQESNDSLYGDDSGKLSGEAWEIQSNASDA